MSAAVPPSLRVNLEIGARLDEMAALLETQGANQFRVRAFQAAASTVRRWPVSMDAIWEGGGLGALQRLPHVGEIIARAIRDLVLTGRLPMLDRIRGSSDPVSLLVSVPGLGPALAGRIHEQLHIGTLEDLETAAYDGRLAALNGFGPRRLRAVRESLAARLGRVRPPAPAVASSPVEELLDVDLEYRNKCLAGVLPRIAPRRLNPSREAWLPILHTTRGTRHYTALFSNTPQAHQLGRTRDWVVLYVDGRRSERQYTVVTARQGSLRGKRVVRGREDECATYYAGLRSSTRRNRAH